MAAHGFETPEQAAMEGFPPAHCRMVESAVDGDDAFVVLDTGPAGRPYLYAGTVHRDAAGWHGGIDGNGGAVGWTITDAERDLGVVAIWDEAPPGADAARIRRGTRSARSPSGTASTSQRGGANRSPRTARGRRRSPSGSAAAGRTRPRPEAALASSCASAQPKQLVYGNSVEHGKSLQFNNVDSPFTRLALRDVRLRFPKRTRNLLLGEPGAAARILKAT
jgi:hypothetical protein